MIYRDYARWLYRYQKYNKASFYSEKALSLIQKNDSLNIQKYAYYLALYQEKEQKFTSSIANYEMSIAHKKDSRYTIFTYEKLGFLYTIIKQYHLALEYRELCIDYHRLNKNTQKLKLAYFYAADILSLMNDTIYYTKGKKYIAKADSLILETETTAREYYDIKTVAANLLNRRGSTNIPKAEEYLLDIIKKAEIEKDSFIITDSYFKLGNLHNETNQKKSLDYLDKALRYESNKFSSLTGRIHSDIGYTYIFHNNYKRSFEHQYKSLGIRLNKKSDHNIDYEDIAQYKDLAKLTVPLTRIAESHLKYYDEFKEEEHLQKSLAFFKLADLSIDKRQENIREFKSRLYWRELGSDLYNKALRACYLKNDLEQTFYYMEKNKMLVFIQDQSKEDYRKTLDIPATIFKRQDKLRNEITLLKEQLLKTGTTSSQAIKEKILASELNLKRIDDSLGLNNGNITPKRITLKDLKTSLHNDELRISYHVSSDDGYGLFSNKENGYLLYVTKDTTQLIEINELTALKKDVESLIASFKKPISDKDAIARQQSLSYSLYQRLFPTEELQQLITEKRVIISPDHFLSFLPFDALQTSLEDGDYLIKKSTISYAPSHTFLNTINDKAITKEHNVLAVAPVTYQDSTLFTLPSSKLEVENIQNYYNSTPLLEEEASKSNFIDHLKNASIVHLSTHAGVQPQDNEPWIAFKDEKLKTYEFNQIKNNADLVFLSACETNLGKVETGEGIMSLTRSFFYGGAKSIISTLWTIDDSSTSIIVNDFYKNLAEGNTKSRALRDAKLAYLSNSSLSEKSPYYWAAFTLLGNDTPLPNKQSNLMYYILGVLIVGAIVFYFIRKKKSSAEVKTS